MSIEASLPRYAYAYKGFVKEGKVFKGYLICKSQAEALDRLKKRQLNVYYCQKAPFFYLKALKSRWQRGASLKTVCTYLDMFIAHGFSVYKALHLTQLTLGEQPLADRLDDILYDISQGKSLSWAFNQHEEFRDTLFIGTLRMAEKADSLTQIWQHFKIYYERKSYVLKKLSGTLILPFITLTLMVALCVIWYTLLAPEMYHLTRQSHTQSLASQPSQITSLLLILPLLGISIGVFSRAVPRRRIFSFLKKHLIWKTKYLMHFLYLLKVQASCGLLLSESLMNIHETVLSFQPITEKILKGLTGGLSMSQAFKATHIFPREVTELIYIAEQTGDFTKSINILAATYDQRFDQQLQRLTQFIPTCLTLFLGLLMVMYICMFQGAYQSITELF